MLMQSWQIPEVVSYASGDVTGDGICDGVSLFGVKTSDSPFTQHITLVVQDGKTGMITTVPLKSNSGYNPSLMLRDFTGNGIDDIMIGIATGGSGGIMIYYLYSFIGNRPQLLFDYEKYNRKFQYDVTYFDHYKVQLFSQRNKMTYLIDLSLRDSDYLAEIYDSKGKLKQPISGFVNPLSGLYPVDYNSDGVYELLAYQRIAGRFNADSLGFVLNTLSWNGNAFVLQNQNVAILGSKIEKDYDNGG